MNQSVTNKYKFNDIVYVYNLNMQFPLIEEICIKGIIENDGILLYTSDKKRWIKEEGIFKNKIEAYLALLKQAEDEMKNIVPEGRA